MDPPQQKTHLRLPTFNGDANGFQVWWMRFKAYATVNRFVQAIGRQQEAALPATEDAVLDVNNLAEKEQDDARKRNSHAMACYTMAFTTNSLMSVVYRARTTEWPNGIAARVTAALFNRYQPSDVLTSMEMKRALLGIHITPTQNPGLLFKKIQAVNNKFEGAIGDEEMLATAIAAAPSQYASTIAAEGLRRGNLLTIEEVERAMKLQWRLAGGRNSKETSEELALVDVECFICHERGHIAKNCPHRKDLTGNEGSNVVQEETRRRSDTKCDVCGRVGHLACRCWWKEENKARRPPWFQKMLEDMKRFETSAANVGAQNEREEDYNSDESDEVELVLSSIAGSKISSSEEESYDEQVYKVARAAVELNNMKQGKAGAKKNVVASELDTCPVGDRDAYASGYAELTVNGKPEETGKRCRLAEYAPERTLGYAEKQQRNIASMRDEKVEPKTADVRTHDDTEKRAVNKKREREMYMRMEEKNEEMIGENVPKEKNEKTYGESRPKGNESKETIGEREPNETSSGESAQSWKSGGSYDVSLGEGIAWHVSPSRIELRRKKYEKKMKGKLQFEESPNVLFGEKVDSEIVNEAATGEKQDAMQF